MSPPVRALPHRHRPGTARAALSYPDYRLLWLGLFASNIGTWMQTFLLPAYVEHRTGSAALVGLLDDPHMVDEPMLPPVVVAGD